MIKKEVISAAVRVGAVTVLALGLGSQAAEAQWGYWNPTIYQSDPQTSMYYDPWTGRLHVHTHRNEVRASALNPYRNQIMPGSLWPVDRTYYGNDGFVYREVGYQWRNAVTGQRHSDVTTTRIGGGPTGNPFSSPSVATTKSYSTARSTALATPDN
jgi:hypothetical protein